MLVTTKVRIRPETLADFSHWQARLNAIITEFPGFISLEILAGNDRLTWNIVQRFNTNDNISSWRHSTQHRELFSELKNLLADDTALVETESKDSDLRAGVTEVFVTQVSPEKEADFRKWIAKIHQVEAQFPGFRGMYVQSPSHDQGRNWITLLQFDTPENLDRWLFSEERKKVLLESKPLISSIENHRVISPFAGWFASIAKEGLLPPVWKQTMIILLVLYPIVMLELKFLPLITGDFTPSVATFISNAISVTLIAWPMMPIALKSLGWWLTPLSKQKYKTFYGTLVILGLYLLEIILFWKLF